MKRSRSRLSKQLAVLILTLSSLSGLAAASPAQDLFDQATLFLDFYYNGFSSSTPRALAAKYQSELRTACEPSGDACEYPVAINVIQKMLKDLGDPHSNYYTPAQLEASRAARSGQGSSALRIGLVTKQVEGTGERLVLDVVENSPAEAAGIKRGDRITGANGMPLPVDEIENGKTISGLAVTGKAFKLSIKRAGNPLEVNVQGKILPVRAPSLRLISGSTYLLRIPDFMGPTVGARIHELVLEAQEKGATGLIVDLRDNGGGLATECLSGVGAFIGEVARVRETKLDRITEGYRNGQLYRRDSKGTESITTTLKRVARWEGPVTAMVNAGTGSCGEYFAADLQLSKRATIIGETTVGVGNTSTQILGLLDGSGLQITYAKSLQADGTPYPERVKPDFEVKDDLDLLSSSGSDQVLNAALERLK
jgi:carboxyl-terminal processing protease